MYSKIILTFLVFSLFFVACSDKQPVPTPPLVTAPADLATHSEEFTPEVIEVTDGVYVAIGFAISNSIRGMNQGLTPDELVETVRLPPHLEASPYLQLFYGTVLWSVRTVFDGYLGWFDGNPTTLNPLPPVERARRLVELVGGVEALEEKMQQALDQQDYAWVLELTDAVLALEPEDESAKQARIDALTALGEQAGNPNTRHYYLTSALELQGLQVNAEVTPDADLIRGIPLEAIFRSMAVNLNPQAAADVDQKVLFQFPDTGETYTVHVRRGVAEIQPFALPDPDITMTVDAQVWKEIMAKVRNPALAIASGDVQVEGGILALRSFLGMFQG